MQGSTAKRRPISRNGVASSSVWETRMKMDELRGGIKVFNGSDDGNGDEEGLKVYRRLRRNQSDGVAADRRKRKNWRPPEPVMSNERSPPIQLRKSRSELSDSPRSSGENSMDSGNENDAIKPLPNVDEIGEKGVIVAEDQCKDDGGDKEVEEEEEEIEVEEGRKSFDDKEIDLPIEKPKNVEEEKKINQIHEISVSQDVEKKLNSVVAHRMMHPDLVKPPHHIEVEEVMFESTSGGHKRMQGIVDLVMWRDISKSAFVFGFGTFFLLSSSYVKDLNFSLISAISYLGLIYLAVIFLYKSILHRGGAVDLDERDERYIVGEEEAIWLVRLLLPYINELLLKVRALFCGDPPTTMKLAVLLFVMARCGSSITIWTLAKLVFFGVFTVPKVCSSYSVQMARYGKFWLERFRDGWESCTHKKAVAAAVFTVIWNLSSAVARAWAVFMLIVVVRFYQQCMVVEEWNGGEEDVGTTEETQEDSTRGPAPSLAPGPVRHRQRSGATLLQVGSERKLKKGL